MGFEHGAVVRRKSDGRLGVIIMARSGRYMVRLADVGEVFTWPGQCCTGKCDDFVPAGALSWAGQQFVDTCRGMYR